MALIEVEPVDDAVVIHMLVPRLDMMLYRRFSQEMQAAIMNKPARVVIDLDRTTSLDSSAVGALKKFLDDVQRYGGRMILCNISKPVMSILQLAHMDKLFEIAEDTDGALLI